jgi:hypothetical protein
MPRKQDFSQSTIYHIRRIETKEVVYVGSSCAFKQRPSTHKHSCCCENDNGYNYPVYVYIREQGGFDLFEVVPVSFHKLENDIQLRIEEQKELDKYPNAFNKRKAYTTKTDSAQYKKEYYKANWEKYKEFRDTHKERQSQEHKKWWEANKERWAQKKKEKVECPCCKKFITKPNLPRHQRDSCPSNP